ncbi:MAG TPA: acyl carrier protein [Bryobacteraceae bacterium]|jgi:acyl carrier protein
MTKQAIRAKVIDLAKQLGNDARKIKDDDVIPSTGFLDSAALMELVIWLETESGLAIDEDQITIENFGTIDAMANYVERHSGAAGSGA